jgi:hypothetical protein
MKYNLRCILFGHKLMGKFYKWINGADFLTHTASPRCAHCGLTKEEVGIVTQQKIENKS